MFSVSLKLKDLTRTRIFWNVSSCTGLVFSLFISCSTIATAYTTNMSASVVVGQPDFSSNSANRGATVSEYGLDSPRSAIIAEGKLLTVEDNNNRVLVWNTVPTTDGVPADVVIGQNSMTESSSGACQAGGKNLSVADSGLLYVNGKLFIVDSAHHRILVFNSIPTTDGATADYVIGQPDRSTCVAGTSQTTLNTPTAIATDGTRLAITDTLNNRVLIYNTIPTADGASADVVVGQPDFATATAGTTQAKFSNPRGVALYNNTLLVAERSNYRITIFNPIPSTDGALANVVLGQSDFTSAVVSPPSTASTLRPFFISVDPLGRLFVADRDASRYLIWNSIPTLDNAPANIVIGQPDFTSTTANNGGISASSVDAAKAVFATSNQMVIVDQANNRILIFNDPVLPQAASSNSGSTFSQPGPASAPSCSETVPTGSPDLFQITRQQTDAKLYFTPVNDDTSAYHVVFGLHEGDERFGSLSIPISREANSGVQSMTISALSPKTEYWFKVAPVHGCAVGTWSNWMKVGKWQQQESFFYRYFPS